MYTVEPGQCLESASLISCNQLTCDSYHPRLFRLGPVAPGSDGPQGAQLYPNERSWTQTKRAQTLPNIPAHYVALAQYTLINSCGSAFKARISDHQTVQT